MGCLFVLLLPGYDFENEASDNVVGVVVIAVMIAGRALVFFRMLPFTSRCSIGVSQRTQKAGRQRDKSAPPSSRVPHASATWLSPR
jgi:hypothetical protein